MHIKTTIFACAVGACLSVLAFVGCANQPVDANGKPLPTSQPTTQQVADAKAQGAAQGQQIGAVAGGIASTATGNPTWLIVGSVAGSLIGGLVGGFAAGKTSNAQLTQVAAEVKKVASTVIPLVGIAYPKAAVIANEAGAVIGAITTPAPVAPVVVPPATPAAP